MTQEHTVIIRACILCQISSKSVESKTLKQRSLKVISKSTSVEIGFGTWIRNRMSKEKSKSKLKTRIEIEIEIDFQTKSKSKSKLVLKKKSKSRSKSTCKRNRDRNRSCEKKWHFYLDSSNKFELIIEMEQSKKCCHRNLVAFWKFRNFGPIILNVEFCALHIERKINMTCHFVAIFWKRIGQTSCTEKFYIM